MDTLAAQWRQTRLSRHRGDAVANADRLPSGRNGPKGMPEQSTESIPPKSSPAAMSCSLPSTLPTYIYIFWVDSAETTQQKKK